MSVLADVMRVGASVHPGFLSASAIGVLLAFEDSAKGKLKRSATNLDSFVPLHNRQRLANCINLLIVTYVSTFFFPALDVHTTLAAFSVGYTVASGKRIGTSIAALRPGS